jgi:outer membrane protein assembly factor BamD
MWKQRDVKRALPGIGAVLVLFAAACASVPRPEPDAPPEERLRYGWELLARKRTFVARQVFEDLIFSAPGSAIIDSAHYGLAEAHFVDANYFQALTEYQVVVSSFPRSVLVDNAAYKVGLCYWKQSLSYRLDQTETRRAIEAFHAFLLDYPASEWVMDAAVQLREAEDKLALKRIYQGETYLKLRSDRDYLAAVIAFSEAIQGFPESSHLPRALWGLGESYFRLKRTNEALQTFGALVSEFADSPYADKARERLNELQPPPDRDTPAPPP